MPLSHVKALAVAHLAAAGLSLVAVGLPLLHAILLLAATGSAAVLALLAYRAPQTLHPLARVFCFAALLTLLFADGNALFQPNPRWAHRTVVYSAYSFVAAAMLLLLLRPNHYRLRSRDAYRLIGAYAIGTLLIALLRPWLAPLIEAAR